MKIAESLKREAEQKRNESIKLAHEWDEAKKAAQEAAQVIPVVCSALMILWMSPKHCSKLVFLCFSTTVNAPPDGNNLLWKTIFALWLAHATPEQTLHLGFGACSWMILKCT